jgi:hypothetical protein
MPEKILSQLKDRELRDLFRYLRSQPRRTRTKATAKAATSKNSADSKKSGGSQDKNADSQQ